MTAMKASITLKGVGTQTTFLTRQFTLDPKGPTILVGRSSSKHKSDRGSPNASNAYFDCPVVSRKHAELFLEGKALRIKDLGSLHGTQVNGRRIKAPETLKTGDILSIGNNIADGAQNFNATIFKIDFQVNEARIVVPRSVVDLSSPAASPRLSATKPSSVKPVLSQARVVWDEIELSPSPMPETTFVGKVANGTNPTVPTSTYAVPDGESDFDSDDEALSMLDPPQSSAANKQNLQSSVTEAELEEVAAEPTAIETQKAGVTRCLAGAGHAVPSLQEDRSQLPEAPISDEEEQEDVDYESSEPSSVAEDYESEDDEDEDDSPPSSELNCSSPVPEPKTVATSKPATYLHDQSSAGTKMPESRAFNDQKNADLADFDFDQFLQGPPDVTSAWTPSAWAPKHHSSQPQDSTRPPWDRVGGFDHFAPRPYMAAPQTTQPAPPPPAPFRFDHNEPHPFYPVNGVSHGVQPRGPWPPAPMGGATNPPRGVHPEPMHWASFAQHTGPTRQQLEDSVVRLGMANAPNRGPLPNKAQNDDHHAALVDRVAISSIVSKPDAEHTSNPQGTKRAAATMLASEEAAGEAVNAEAGQAETLGPAPKRLRVEREVSRTGFNKSSRATTVGAFALGAAAGGLAFMGALLTLPDSLFF